MSGLRDPRCPVALARSNVPVQFAWYLVVGGLSFAADLAVFLALLNVGSPVSVALVLGFIVGTLANYGLSLLLAFTPGRHKRVGELVRIFGVAFVGLNLTALVVWSLMAFGTTALVGKVIATPVVLVWNYLGRRTFVFRSEMPTNTWRISGHALATLRTVFRRTERRDD